MLKKGSIIRLLLIIVFVNALQEREKLRKNKDWQKADEIRKQIEKRGFVIEDTAQSPLLKKSP